MILRTTLPAIPSSYKTPSPLNVMCSAIWDGPFCWGNVYSCVLACLRGFFVIERMVANGKNIKNLKFSKLKFSWFFV